MIEIKSKNPYKVLHIKNLSLEIQTHKINTIKETYQ